MNINEFTKMFTICKYITKEIINRSENKYRFSNREYYHQSFDFHDLPDCFENNDGIFNIAINDDELELTIYTEWDYNDACSCHPEWRKKSYSTTHIIPKDLLEKAMALEDEEYFISDIMDIFEPYIDSEIENIYN